MHHYKVVDRLGALEAVHQIAALASSIDFEGLTWYGAEHAADNRERLKKALSSVLEYLHRLYERDKAALGTAEVRKGIQAVMWLAAEAAQKIDQYAQGKEESVFQFKEYQDLQHFCARRIDAQPALPHQEEEMVSPLLTWDLVCQDQLPELIWMRQAGGSPFFSPGLIRHLQWVIAFDHSVSGLMGDDFLIRLEEMKHWSRYEAALEIKEGIRAELDEYCLVARQHHSNPLVKVLNCAIMALLLAAHPSHLKMGLKSCSQYLADFHQYLRVAILLSKEAESWKWLSRLLDACVEMFFVHKELYPGLEVVWKGLVEEGAKEVRIEPSASWLQTLVDEDALIRAAIKRHPHGPLMKTFHDLRLNHFRDGYDPLALGYEASCLYTLSIGDRQVDCLRLPSPTRQETLEGKVEIVPEFKAFIRGEKHLMVLLEDSLSPLSSGRCEALRALEQELQGALLVVNLPRSGDFYTQSGAYIDEESPPAFIEHVLKYPFGLSIDMRGITEGIHQKYFGGKGVFTRKNRLDFIEIFYHAVIKQVMEEFRPDRLSFVCKDGIDASSAAAAGFYVFCHSTVDKKTLIEWLYGPALSQRHRAIHEEQFARFISAVIEIQNKY